MIFPPEEMTVNFKNQTAMTEGPPADGSVEIVKVEDRWSRDAFIRLPMSLYADDPAWVPPLLIERRMHLSSDNPYFKHAVVSFWMACRRGRPVGRISAQIDRLHLEQHQDDTGFWGMLEAEDNLETFRALLGTAEDWLRSQGMKRARGPFNLSINQECGMLVSGFDAPPAVMMGHARPYYGRRIEQCGYLKEKDLLAYRIDVAFEASRIMRTVVSRSKGRLQTRPLRKKHFREDMEIMRSLFNDAWLNNWGFVPFTEEEFEDIGRFLKFLVPEDTVRIAEVDGTPAAFIVGLPNLNEAIRHCRGRLWPWGWFKLFWRLKVKHPETARVILMGVRRIYQNSLLGAGLAYRLIDELREMGVRYGTRDIELSWILEDNAAMREIIEDVGGREYKRYRIYGRDL
ncbi:MAG: hypothetical protein A4E72_01556 [Syntrophus sp. PtaU1.Bin208]|nr:MAG: hypothetical protein A4E72_01556 [Syntrophus sp. PtaU1.Bin208]